MGSIEAPQSKPVFGTLRFSEPDLSVSAAERALYTFPATKRFTDEAVQLHDFNAAEELTKGAEGIDVQGFSYIKHRSIITEEDEWFTGQNVEEKYIPETEELVLKITGARKAVVSQIGFRRRLVEPAWDPNYAPKKGSAVDERFSKVPRNAVLVVGRQEGTSLEPVRDAHVDFTTKGLRATARYSTQAIRDGAKEALAAEDANASEVPRYSCYSVWRPIETVKRDPLAVCDWRTMQHDKDLIKFEYRSLSGAQDTGEYLNEAYKLPPPEHAGQKWYWMPEQTPDDVLVLKLGDTGSDSDPAIAAGCGHASPAVQGTENEVPRKCIVARVFAFW